ncbi:CRISPR-associated endonuclease Cas3'' [Streptomyces sp. URMC 129]|uniref:CRISPR-associated endonuclease Cas3'' n=1 Tax=Streptomyces sp. URMC 129 TaxID=3423407 RepID=UPI003F1A7E04
MDDPRVRQWLDALWGKSPARGGGTRSVLLAHLLDTAAVAERIWDNYLDDALTRVLDDVAGGAGRGKGLFVWLCGIHDCGKATPAFQCVDPTCAQAVRDAGLSWDRAIVENPRNRRRHDVAGAALLDRRLAQAGWAPEHVAWVWPLVAGHHGSFPDEGGLAEGRRTRGHLQGRGPDWAAAQEAVVGVFTRAVGYPDLTAVQPTAVPSRAVQLALSGLIVMADWIASDHRHFDGLDSIDKVSLAGSRERARAAWNALRLHGGWRRMPVPGPEAFRDRFGHGTRPSQRFVIDIAHRMAEPGLLIVEAPMGEGKTKAALMAAEILGARFGANGTFLGMPTQATCDPMFTEMRQWTSRIRPGLESEVALLHGKRRFTKEWKELLEGATADADDADPFGMADDDALYGMGMGAGIAIDCGEDGEAERRAPAEWFLGAKRGLLTPFVVGTIDQLLFAATRTKHVMLRSAGLAGKVVVLDEVHAADVYMSQFLKEGLWWLGQGRVPVVLLSATLPPAQREELVSAYLAGAASADVFEVGALLPEPGGYPSVTAAWLDGKGDAQLLVEHAQSWRDDLAVAVRVLDEERDERPDERPDEDHRPPGHVRAGDRAVAGLLADRLRDGGCALVIRNTVARAQDTYRAVGEHFGADADVRLLHGRLHAADRAERTEACLRLLGRPGPGRVAPGKRLILVATQIAEQSFDVDADILITDVAPIDHLLQRIGRLHRHAHPAARPKALRTPEVVVTGFARRGQGRGLWWDPGTKAIYGEYLLLRTAVEVLAADGGAWAIPRQVPELVARVYDGDPAADERKAFEEWAQRQTERAAKAEKYLLTRRGEHGRPTLAGLHYAGRRGESDDERFRALVRDGEPSAEVILVRRDDDLGYRTLAGRRLSVNGEVAPEQLDEVLGATVRLPSGGLSEAAERDLGPLAGWRDDPWLRHSKALVLDAELAAVVGEFAVRYDPELGLVTTRGT